jgi:hypothetical protein
MTDMPNDPHHTDAGQESPADVADGVAADGEFRIADLAAAVADLAVQLEQVQALIRTAAYGTDQMTTALQADLETLAARVDELDPRREADLEADEPEPQAWVDYAAAQDWHDLATWTDWLTRTYDVQADHMVLPCWPAHRGVAEELAALRTAWRSAAIAGRGTQPGDAMIDWHDRWLHPTLLRVRGEFQQRTCVDRHHPTWAGPSTDPALLATAKLAATELTDH